MEILGLDIKQPELARTFFQRQHAVCSAPYYLAAWGRQSEFPPYLISSSLLKMAR